MLLPGGQNPTANGDAALISLAKQPLLSLVYDCICSVPSSPSQRRLSPVCGVPRMSGRDNVDMSTRHICRPGAGDSRTFSNQQTQFPGQVRENIQSNTVKQWCQLLWKDLQKNKIDCQLLPKSHTLARVSERQQLASQ